MKLIPLLSLIASVFIIGSMIIASFLAVCFPSESIISATDIFLFSTKIIVAAVSGFLFITFFAEKIIFSRKLRVIGGILLVVQMFMFGVPPFLGGIHYEVMPFLYPFLIFSIFLFLCFVWPLCPKITNRLDNL